MTINDLHSHWHHAKPKLAAAFRWAAVSIIIGATGVGIPLLMKGMIPWN